VGGGNAARKDWLAPAKVLLTFVLMLVGWVFFRAADLRQSFQVLSQMFAGGAGPGMLLAWHKGLIVTALLLALAEEKRSWFDRVVASPAYVYAGAMAAMLLTIEVFGVLDASIPFIYFQF
jgi:hypothetical protein